MAKKTINTKKNEKEELFDSEEFFSHYKNPSSPRGQSRMNSVSTIQTGSKVNAIGSRSSSVQFIYR